MNTITLEDVLRNAINKLCGIRVPIREQAVTEGIRDVVSDLMACVEAMQEHDRKLEEQRKAEEALVPTPVESVVEDATHGNEPKAT